MLFIFNPDNLKFTLTRPIAGMGAIEKLIDAGDHLMAFEADDYNKRTGNPKIMNDIIGVMPGKKLIQAGVDLISEDE